MIPKWTGNLVGKMHVEGVSVGELSDYMGLHPKYVSAILNGKRTPRHARDNFNDALDKLLEERRESNGTAVFGSNE